MGGAYHLLAYARDPIGVAGRLFARYGPLASIVRAPVRMMSRRGIGVLVANGAALNREVLTEHERYRSYALPGFQFPDDEALAALPTP